MISGEQVTGDAVEQHRLVIAEQHRQPFAALLHRHHHPQQSPRRRPAIDQVAQQNEGDALLVGPSRVVGLDPADQVAEQVEPAVDVADRVHPVVPRGRGAAPEPASWHDNPLHPSPPHRPTPTARRPADRLSSTLSHIVQLRCMYRTVTIPRLYDRRFSRVNGTLTASAPLTFQDAQSGGSAFHKKRLRALLYIGLILCDCAAIRSGLSIGSSVHGWRWLTLYGLDVGWLVLPLHIALSLRNRAISIEALQRRSESLRRGASALVVGFAVVILLMFLRFANLQVSRLAFGTSIVSAVFFLCVFRLFFYSCFVAPVKGGLTAELLIVDGITPRVGAYHVFDAAAEAFAPDLNDPATLGRLTTLLAPYDRVVVNCPEHHRHAWAHLLKTCNIIGEIQLDDGLSLGAIGVGRYHGSDTVVVARGPMSLNDRFNKRVMDLILAGGVVIAIAPLLIVIALAIKLDSSGPILFAQTRLGRNNRPFKILKFRSMYVEHSDTDGNRSATRDDDRVTRVGRILRMTSLDELPQLLNVLLGSMSIVGPRPHALGSLAGDKLFWEISERYWLRHALKPGITGLAQVRGFRGATHHQSDLEDRLQSDLEYIAGWRLWRDITIIANTIRVIIHPRAF